MVKNMDGKNCSDLITHKDELRKKSIYLLKDDQDKDFDIFVMIDDPEKRTDFLEILHAELIKAGKSDEKHNQALMERHKEKLKEWFGEDNRDLFTPLNWLKVAIEDYPMRLLVVIDAKNWEVEDEDGKYSPFDKEYWIAENQSTENRDTKKEEDEICTNRSGGGEAARIGNEENKNIAQKTANGSEGKIVSLEDNRKWKKSKFLYKRICWVKADDFFNEIAKIKEDKGEHDWSRLYRWLYFKWLGHVAGRVRDDVESLKSVFLQFGGLYVPPQTEPYFPLTLPVGLRATEETKKGDCSSVRVDFKNSTIEPREKTDKGDFLLVYDRHNAVRYYADKGVCWNIPRDDIFYSEALSGGMSIWLQLSELLGRFQRGEELPLPFLLSLVESALLRMGIVDERLQGWYKKLDTGDAGNLVQTGVFIGHFNDIDRSDNGFHLNIKMGTNDKLVGKVVQTDGGLIRLGDYELYYKGKSFEKILPRERLGIDILIVHQGILDKFEGLGDRLEASRTILKWKDKIPFFAITSGRGTPENIPSPVKFIPFSGLDTCICSRYFEKVKLLRELSQTKCPEVKGDER